MGILPRREVEALIQRFLTLLTPAVLRGLNSRQACKIGDHIARSDWLLNEGNRYAHRLLFRHVGILKKERHAAILTE